MKVDITMKIREDFNMTLPEYAKAKKIDLAALRHILYNGEDKTTRVSESMQHKAKKALVADGYLDKEVLELEKKVTYSMRAKERKKIVARLRRCYKMSIKDFYEKNKDYFDEHLIDISYLYVFLSGIGTGKKPGTKAYHINEKLKDYPLLLDPNAPNKKELTE